MSDNDNELRADYILDGGDQGCGELLLEMKLKMRKLAVGNVMQVITTDPGAREDLPSWCRMTGHTLLGESLLKAKKVGYFIRKEREEQ